MSGRTLPRWHEVTALLGGRFDPPHLGHRQAVRGLFRNPGVREVRIIPSASPPHKPTCASQEDRAEMTKLNFASLEGTQLDYRELNRAKSNPIQPSYTYDTLIELRSELPNVAFVLGADQLAQFHTWHRFPEILELCHWIVLERKPSGGDIARKILQEWKSSGLIRSTSESSTWQIANHPKYLTLVPTDAPGFSSTSIRESIARSGSEPPASLLPEVLAYLKEHKLYGI